MHKFLFAACVPFAFTACVSKPIDYQQQAKDQSMQRVETIAKNNEIFLRNNDEQSLIDFSIKQVRKKLKDPDSATFQNVRTAIFSSGKVVCGEVNAKNSYGGYVGFSPFVAGVIGAELYDNSSKYLDIRRVVNFGIDTACQ